MVLFYLDFWRLIMEKNKIEELISKNSLRRREIDFERVKSLLKSAEVTVKVVKNISLNDETATTIFRELYEAIRQLGEAKWWLNGYEPYGLGSHGLALDILKEFNVKNKVKLNYLDRFKKIRHDANYRGMFVSFSQAKELIEFWDSCGKEILESIKKLMK